MINIPRPTAQKYKQRGFAENRTVQSMVTDVSFWTDQFTMLSELVDVQGLQKVIEGQQMYLETMKQAGLKGKDEKRFYSELSGIHKILSQQGETLTINPNDYADIAKRLQSFHGDSNTCTDILCKMYTKYRESLEKQTHLVKLQRQKYYEAAFSLEKAEIKVKMATGPKALRKARKRLNSLHDKTNMECSKYFRQFDKWNRMYSITQVYSEESELSYLARESNRADIILQCLQTMADRTIAGKFRTRNPMFKKIDERRFIRDKLIEREVYQAPSFQGYVGEIGKTDMYERLRNEIENVTNTNNSSTSHTSSSEFDPSDLQSTFRVNKKIASRITVVEVKHTYYKQHVNQLNLKPGDRIKQILPANTNGLAYGERSRGIFQTTKKGFFPVSHVDLIPGFNDVRC